MCDDQVVRLGPGGRSLRRPGDPLLLFLDEFHSHLIVGPGLQHPQDNVICGQVEEEKC